MTVDPNACYLRWLTARATEEHVWKTERRIDERASDDASHAAEELLTWLRRGGAEPDWTETQRETFFAKTEGL